MLVAPECLGSRRLNGVNAGHHALRKRKLLCCCSALILHNPHLQDRGSSLGPSPSWGFGFSISAQYQTLGWQERALLLGVVSLEDTIAGPTVTEDGLVAAT